MLGLRIAVVRVAVCLGSQSTMNGASCSTYWRVGSGTGAVTGRAGAALPQPAAPAAQTRTEQSAAAPSALDGDGGPAEGVDRVVSPAWFAAGTKPGSSSDFSRRER